MVTGGGTVSAIHILLRIALIQPPSQNNGDHQVYWAESNNRSFMVKSAYNAISSYHNRNEDFSWDIVWRWKGPQSIRTFLWLVTHNRLKTKAELARRHILADAGCDHCGCGVEDRLHVLRDCMAAKRIWHRLIPVEALQFFFDPPLREWL